MAQRCRQSPAPEDSLRAFLVDTLALWHVEARVEAGVAPVVAVIERKDGTAVWIERPQTPTPFRWLVRSRVAEDPAGSAREDRPRPCASLVGLLSTLRSAFGFPRGTALRVAAATRARPPEHTQRELEQRHGPPLPTNGQRIPVTVLTGFLGSGKTTLLGRLLRDPGMTRTAVIINEFGEIGLDHELVETSEESFVSLTNGCLCCKVRSDLALTLGDLAVRRSSGALPRFERVVIETSGLADPAPILHALMLDPALAEVYTLESVIATADAVTGLSTLEHYPESLKQVALADRIALTKTDVPGVDTARIAARLAQVNPRAPRLDVARGEVQPSTLFASSGKEQRSTTSHPELVLAEGAAHRHTSGITSFAVVRSDPLHAATLPLFLSALAESCGTDLLRMKGIVRIAEEPERPAVIHGVQHVYHAPDWLERWPSEDRRTRLVFIGRDLSQRWVSGLLDLLETEVTEVSGARTGAAG